MKTTYLTLISAAAMLAASLPAAAQSGGGNFASNGTTTVNVSIAAEAAIRIDTGSTALSTSGVGFTSDYTGATNFTYKIRTQKSGGTGTVTLKVTADFPSGTGGPSVASPPTAGDTLQYTCTVTSPGTACSGSQTASTTASTPLATFGADAKSVKAGTGGNAVNWTLTNDPAYSTGSYAATVTLTISAA